MGRLRYWPGLVLIAVLFLGCQGRSPLNSAPVAQPPSSMQEGFEAALLSTDSASSEQYFHVRVQPQEPQELPLSLKSVSWALPQQLASQLPQPKSLSYTQDDQLQNASGFIHELPYNRVSGLIEPMAVFTPSWDPAGQPTVDDLAYATYRFTLPGYNGEATLGTIWQYAPPEPGVGETAVCWVGLSNWERGCWDWYAGPADYVLSVASLDPYVADDGELLVVVLLLGTTECALSELAVGVSEIRLAGDLGLTGEEESTQPPLDAGGELPASYDLAPECSPVRNQGLISSCSAFAVGDGAFNYELGQIYGPYGWDFSDKFNLVSPRYIYIETGSGPEKYNPRVGRYMQTVIGWLKDQGTATEANAPYGSLVPGPGWCDDDWSTEALADATLLDIESFENVNCNGWSDINTIKTILANQQRVLVTRLTVDYSFGDYWDGVWNYVGPPKTNHAMCIVGYDDTLEAFKVRNCWGAEWGNLGGYCWIGYDTFLNSQVQACCWVLRDEFDAAVSERFLGFVPDLAPPASVSASDGVYVDRVLVEWAKVPSADGYKIYRDTKTNAVATLGDLSAWEDTNIADHLSHSYWVRAVRGIDESDFSASDGGFLAQAPEISGVAPTSGQPGEQISPIASVYGSTPMNYSWNFGGGANPNTSTAASPTVTLGAKGEYSASVTISNTYGSEQYPFTLSVVSETPPNAVITGDPMSGTAPLAVDFDASDSADSDGTIVQFEWDWEGDGTYDSNTGAVPVTSHNYTSGGIYDAAVRVTDDDGLTGTASVSGSGIVVSQPPTAVLSATPRTGPYPLAVNFDASGSSDAGGSIAKYEWDWDGDGTYDFDSGTDPTVQHTYTTYGVWLAVVRVTDDDSEQDSAGLAVSAVIWSYHTVDTTGDVGLDTSMAIIGGKPAIVYRDNTNEDIKYARSTVAAPSSIADWTNHIVDATADPGSMEFELAWHAIIALSDGNPAIGYEQNAANRAWFARATSTTPSSASDWVIHQFADDSAAGPWISSILISNKPIMCYPINGVNYCRATVEAPSGASDWLVHAADTGQQTGVALNVLGGMPVMAYADYDGAWLSYLRATVAQPSNIGDWVMTSIDDRVNAGYTPCLEILNGKPIISYTYGADSTIWYASATTATPTGKNDWVRYELASGGINYGNSLCIIDGKPAVTFWDGRLRFAWAATDAPSSSDDWAIHIVDSSADVGRYAYVTTNTGFPAISYYDYTNKDLKYASGQ